MSTRRDNRTRGRRPRQHSGQKHPETMSHSPVRQRATDQEIQKWILRQHGFVPESAWILHCKELFGLATPGTESNENPCPPERQAAIEQAFRRFGLL